MTYKTAWKKEKEKHLGDYGDSNEYDLECAFRAGYYQGKKDSKKKKRRRRVSIWNW